MLKIALTVSYLECVAIKMLDFRADARMPPALIVHGPRADFRCRGSSRPESSPQVFLIPKTLNLKKKSGGHLSAVAFGSERPLSENIYTF